MALRERPGFLWNFLGKALCDSLLKCLSANADTRRQLDESQQLYRDLERECRRLQDEVNRRCTESVAPVEERVRILEAAMRKSADANQVEGLVSDVANLRGAVSTVESELGNLRSAAAELKTLKSELNELKSVSVTNEGLEQLRSTSADKQTFDHLKSLCDRIGLEDLVAAVDDARRRWVLGRWYLFLHASDRRAFMCRVADLI
jgi:DNA repair exonuclease SbcCD ATPase subunit